MAYKIVEDYCTGCSVCESECPNDAIIEKSGLFRIDGEKCTECVGYYDEPQCVAACPIPDACVVDDRYPRAVAA
jgi:ferredoxin